MNYVNYSTTTQAAQSGKFPVTIQGLEFTQSQILEIQKIALLGGKCYIIVEPNGSINGVIVWDGEILPLQGIKAANIRIVTTTENISTDSGLYEEARKIRFCEYTSDALIDGNLTIRASDEFKRVRTNLELELLRGSLDVKIVNKTELWVRHGLLSDDDEIKLMIKKRRSRRVDDNGNVILKASNGWRNYQKIVLSKGTPNVWYQPVVLSPTTLLNRSVWNSLTLEKDTGFAPDDELSIRVLRTIRKKGWFTVDHSLNTLNFRRGHVRLGVAILNKYVITNLVPIRYNLWINSIIENGGVRKQYNRSLSLD